MLLSSLEINAVFEELLVCLRPAFRGRTMAALEAEGISDLASQPARRGIGSSPFHLDGSALTAQSLSRHHYRVGLAGGSFSGQLSVQQAFTSLFSSLCGILATSNAENPSLSHVVLWNLGLDFEVLLS